MTGPKVLRPIFALLRRFAPILMVGKRAVISRHADVVEVLTRDADFTVSQINAPNINRLDGPFNGVQIPEVIAAMLRLSNLRRAGCLEYEGPFPQRMLVEFD